MTIVQHRQPVVLLFTDICGSTGIAGQMEPEQYAELLGRLRDLLDTVVTRHGGEVLRIDGDGALCLFGYPVSHEDAGRRAVEAALDLHAGAALLDVGLTGMPRALKLHSGIHGGTVLLRHGDMIRGRYEVLGDATNVAARLCDAAMEDGILASAVALGTDSHFFETAGKSHVRVAGHAHAVAAVRVTGRAQVPHRYAARLARRRLALIGRDAERAAFAQWLDGGTGAKRTMLIHGPAGIGKSRLIEQLAGDAVAVGWQVAQGWCEAYLSTQVLQPFLQIAEQLRLGGDGALPDAGQIVAGLAATGERARLLLVIDDWQWTDDASRDVLQALLTRTSGGDQSVRILLAYRDSAGAAIDDDGADHMALAPFGAADAQRAISALWRQADAFSIETISEAAGGSPLLIEELCHAFAAGRTTLTDHPRDLWFDMAVQARARHLSVEAQSLLHRAAVIGHNAPYWMLAALQGAALTEAVIEELDRADFVDSVAGGDNLRFKHGLTRDAIYAGIGRADRLAMHQAILSVLEERAAAGNRRSQLDALAHHSAASGVAGPAICYAIEAVDAALADDALDRAQGHVAVVLPLAASIVDRTERVKLLFRLLHRYGLACIYDPSAEQMLVLEAFRRQFAADAAHGGVVRATYWLGCIAYGLGRGKAAVTYLEQALALATGPASEPTDARLIDHLRLRLAGALSTAGRFDDGVALVEAWLANGGADDEEMDKEARIYAQLSFAFLLADRGDTVRSDQIFAAMAAAITDNEGPINLSYHSFLASAEVLNGRWRRAIIQSELIEPYCMKARARMQLSMNAAVTAYAEWRLHGLPDAIERLERCADWYRGGQNSEQRATLVFGWLVDALADQGERDRARAQAIRVVQRIRHTGDRFGETLTWRALARLEAAAGNRHRADHYLARADRSAIVRASPREAVENARCRAAIKAVFATSH